MLIFMQEWRLLQLDKSAQHSDTHSCVMWNVGIQSNVIDNNKMQCYKLICNSCNVEKLTRSERTWIGLQVLIHALKDRFRKAMPIKYILPLFSYVFTQNSSPFHAIITSSSNMLHASSMNNHS